MRTPHNKNQLFLFALLLLTSFVVLTDITAQNDSVVLDQKELVIETNPSDSQGFISTFVRTPFALFCFAGVLSGVIFSAIIEFLCNLFTGFDYGYGNTSTLWNLGWKQLLVGWYWTPSVWWHVLISVVVWGPLLNRKKDSKS